MDDFGSLGLLLRFNFRCKMQQFWGCVVQAPFIAEKRPEPKKMSTAADRGRNKRMLGALMGHLHKAECALSMIYMRSGCVWMYCGSSLDSQGHTVRIAARILLHWHL